MRMVLLDRTEPRASSRGRDVVGEGDSTLDTTFTPGFFFTTEVALHPGDGDAGPYGGPNEGEGPAQLVLLARS